ncbi:hypothetical protein PCURB6_27850 [Paenibacillus curdlanolyticus]|nr:hypothetical protein [Paenibacillus curdlanolyticus]GFN32525.1 hypothetical protein PCURB6_27850 [Paenibacillus curdlanolyticus]
MKPENMINREVHITDKESDYFGHWGYIRMWDGDVFHVNGGSISSSFGEVTPVFDRSQFRVRRRVMKV